MEIEGNLVIRWHERGMFEVRLVPTGAVQPPGGARRRLPDRAALEAFLTELGLPAERVERALRSPYVLQSLQVRVDEGVASRLGLVQAAWSRRLLGALTVLARRTGLAARRLGRPR